VTLPLLLIYRRFYGSGAALRLFLLLWPLMSGAGLLVDLVFHALGLLPSTRHSAALAGHFPLGTTLVLNCLAVRWCGAVGARPPARRGPRATDPICGMHVDTTRPRRPGARRSDQLLLLAAMRREFEREGEPAIKDHANEAIDPVCSMKVDPKQALWARGPDAVTYYFCSPGCRETFSRTRALSPARQQSNEDHTVSRQHTSVRAYGVLIHEQRIALVRSSNPRHHPPSGGCPEEASSSANLPRTRCTANSKKRPASKFASPRCSHD